MTESEAVARSTFSRFFQAWFLSIVVNVVVFVATSASIWIWLCAVLLIISAWYFGYNRRDTALHVKDTMARPEVRHFAFFTFFAILAVVIVLTNFVIASTGASEGVRLCLVALAIASGCHGWSAVDPAEQTVNSP